MNHEIKCSLIEALERQLKADLRTALIDRLEVALVEEFRLKAREEIKSMVSEITIDRIQSVKDLMEMHEILELDMRWIESAED